MAFLIGTVGSINTKISVLHGLTCFNLSQSPGDLENICSIQRSWLSGKVEAVCLESQLCERRCYAFLWVKVTLLRLSESLWIHVISM